MYPASLECRRFVEFGLIFVYWTLTFCGDPDRGIPHNVSFGTSFLENLSDNNITVDMFCYVCIFDCSITHIFTMHG